MQPSKPQPAPGKTRTIIDACNNKKNRNLGAAGLARQRHTLACCLINVAEVYAGLRPKEEPRTAALLGSLILYPITFPIARLAGRLKRDYSLKGKTLSIPDTIVAAVALHHQIALITDNRKDVPRADLVFHSLPNGKPAE